MTADTKLPIQDRHQQLPLPISARKLTPLAAELPLSDANARALAMVRAWLEEANGGLVVAGPDGCGKTALLHGVLGGRPAWWLETADVAVPQLAARVTQISADHILVLDQHDIPSDAALLMRFINICLEQGRPFILIGRGDPSGWAETADGALVDLETRLAAMPKALFLRPEEAQLQAYVAARLKERQLKLADPLRTHAILRLQRSYEAMDVFIDHLDAEALHRQKTIDRAMIDDVIELLPEYALN